MRIVLFCQSLISDWNHGNAHFLRGVMTELMGRGHQVSVYEPHDGWSRTNLLAEAGQAALDGFHGAFPRLRPQVVDFATLPLDEILDDVDLVLVHEWTPPALVKRIGLHKVRTGGYTLLFHDTHHRSVSDVEAMSRYCLEHYDGVLAFGDVIRERYVTLGWSRQAWTWHEAADTRVFRPLPDIAPDRDLVWIGNWGDGERSEELRAYLMAPVRDLSLSASVHGVRYPPFAIEELAAAGIVYGGWIANYEAPAVYARHRMTIHVPRGPYVRSLPGVPTIRVFEALACGVPLVSLPLAGVAHLFAPGDDYLVADSPARMRTHLRALRADPDMRQAIATRGLATIRRRHTCAHRVDELLGILRQVAQGTREEPARP